MQLYLDDSAASLALQALNNSRIPTSSSSQGLPANTQLPALSEGGRVLVSGAGAVLDLAQKIVDPHQAAILGSTDEEKKEVDKWVKVIFKEYLPSFQGNDANAMKKLLFKLNKDLQSVVFLINNKITIVDLLLFAAIYPAFKEWKDEDRFTFINITRWFDFLQHQEQFKSNLAVVSINRNVPENFGEKKEKPQPQSQAPPQQPQVVEEKPKPQQPPTTQNEDKPKEQAQQSKEEKPQQSKEEKPQPAKKEKQQKQAQPTETKKPQGGKGAAAPKEEEKPVDVSRLDLRVGKIVKVDKHPTADTLYVEEIDLGETAGPRQVVSGLVNFVPIDQMRNRYVAVVCNLKPANLRGVKSAAMVLAASDNEHTKVELLDIPEGSRIGERIFVEGYLGEPDAQLNPKHKVWETVQPEFITNGQFVATYRGVPFQTSAGILKVKTIAGGNIK